MKKIVAVIFFVAFAGIYLNFFYSSDVTQELAQAQTTKQQSTATLFSTNTSLASSAQSIDKPLSHSNNTADAQRKIGLTFSAQNSESLTLWADALSRNPLEHQARLDDLQFALHAEVIAFPAFTPESLTPSSDVNNPTVINLPSLGQEQLSVAVLAKDMQVNGNGHITGTLAGDPTSSVVLGFHDGQTSGMIESANRVYFYDAYDGKAVIVRELDADKYRAATKADGDGLEVHTDEHE
jgi:hypothetical protein